MGVLDKLKNALFEVEYVEVEEPPKKEKKVKIKEKKEKEKVQEKPIAKKIVLPGKKEEKIEELEEEELKDEDFEIRPKNEVVKEKPHEEFKFMDDKDFEVEGEHVTPDTPQILEVIEDEHRPRRQDREERKVIEQLSEPEEFLSDRRENYSPYQNDVSYRNTNHDNKLYGVDNTYKVPVHEYGAYEKKEDKTYFKPSPIISPIYGILDKNYKKEDVKEKQEIRLTTYTRSNVSVDDIRNKAYGSVEKEKEVEKEEETKFEVEDDDENLLVDLSDRAKPEVKELTMGDAMEYFQDLGLEYNVDYVDVSKEKKKVEEKPEIIETATESVGKHVKTEEKEEEKVVEEKKTTKVVEIENASKTVEEDNDNLFDLIDSMYEEKGE